MEDIDPSACWRDSARRVRFFIWDCQAAFPFLIWMLHMRLWTFIFALISAAFFVLLARFGFTTTVFLRLFRQFLAGGRKVSRPFWLS